MAESSCSGRPRAGAAATSCCSPSASPWSTAGSSRPRSPTSRATSAWSPPIREAMAAPTGRRGATTSRAATATCSRCWRRRCGRPSRSPPTPAAALIAFRYAVDHPGHVSHLILLSGQYAESMPQPFEEKVARVMRGDFAAYRQRLFARVLPEPHSLKGIEDGVAWAGETTPEVLVESLRAIDGANVHDLLARISVPTLALHGTLDRIVPYTHAEKMVAAIPGARLVTFEGAGHSLHGRARGQGESPDPRLRPRPPRGGGRHSSDDGAEGTAGAPAPNRGAPRPLAVEPDRPRPHPAGPRHRASAAGDPPRRHRGFPGRCSLRPGRGGLGRAPAPRQSAAPRRERAHRGVGPRPRAARAERAVGHGRDHGGQLHDVRGRRGTRGLRPLGGRRGLGPRLLSAREPGAEAGAVRVSDRLHRRPAHAGRQGVGGVPARLGQERREHRSPAPAPRRARPVHHGRRRGGRPRPRVRARPAEHAAVGARALPLLRIHVSLRPRHVRGQGRVAARAGLSR